MASLKEDDRYKSEERIGALQLLYDDAISTLGLHYTLNIIFRATQR